MRWAPISLWIWPTSPAWSPPGWHPSPVPYADVVSTTTHKTLRGPRGGMFLCNDPDIAKKLNSAIFPGSQGGPLEHIIAAKAVALGEALRPEFKAYQQQIVKNAAVLAQTIMEGGLDLVSGGTDNHLMLPYQAFIPTRKKGESICQEAILQTQELTRRYGHTLALDRASLSVEKGQIFGLVGRNGAGKTTLIRLISGQSMPTSGQISLFGQTSDSGLNRARSRTGAMVEIPPSTPTSPPGRIWSTTASSGASPAGAVWTRPWN